MIKITSKESSSQHISTLKADEFVRQRINPRRTDYYYLHLADLLSAIKGQATAEALKVLDFGAGGSPYRKLFPNAEYKTADLTDSMVDYTIEDSSLTNAPDRYFDIVLSTQVLEHCPNPQVYLAEASRVLKPGGKIILSTHGQMGCVCF